MSKEFIIKKELIYTNPEIEKKKELFGNIKKGDLVSIRTLEGEDFVGFLWNKKSRSWRKEAIEISHSKKDFNMNIPLKIKVEKIDYICKLNYGDEDV